jgi:hypothetical protein
MMRLIRQQLAALLLAGVTTIASTAPLVAFQGASCGDPLRQNGRDRGLSGLALAADGIGNVFVAEIGTTVVRRIAPDGMMTTVAGNGSRGHSGDGGSAVAAGFNPITAIAADSVGNLFIAETINPRIRKVTTTGMVTTVAGDGRLRADGDRGPAIAASLCGPLSLAVDPSGNLYISSGTGRLADAFIQGDYRVRKVATDGTITTVAGSGQPPRGMGYGIDPAPDGTSALQGGLWPAFLAADNAGNLFIHDARSVRKVTPSGIVTTVVAPALEVGIAIDRTGNIFTVQAAAIVKVSPAGATTSIAGSGARGSSGDGGPAAAAQLDFMRNRGGGSALTIDGRGNLYFAETSRRIRKITPEGVISTVGQIPQ